MNLADFSVTVSDVTDKLPFVGNQVGKNTNPLSTGDIEGIIQDGESKLSNKIEDNGGDPSNLTDDEKREIQEAVEAYAVKESLDILGAVGERYNRYSDKWERMWSRFNSDNSSTGGKGGGNSVVTNIKANQPAGDSREKDDFMSHDYEF